MNTQLTDNELRAALILVESCLDGMGGERPSDLEQDEYTWVSAKDLMDAGYSSHEAAGTIGALMDKGFVSEYEKHQLILNTEAWKYLDTIWDNERNGAMNSNGKAEFILVEVEVDDKVRKASEEAVRCFAIGDRAAQKAMESLTDVCDEADDPREKITAMGAALGLMQFRIKASVAAFRKVHPKFAEFVDSIEKTAADELGSVREAEMELLAKAYGLVDKDGKSVFEK